MLKKSYFKNVLAKVIKTILNIFLFRFVNAKTLCIFAPRFYGYSRNFENNIKD